MQLILRQFAIVCSLRMRKKIYKHIIRLVFQRNILCVFSNWTFHRSVSAHVDVSNTHKIYQINSIFTQTLHGSIDTTYYFILRRGDGISVYCIHLLTSSASTSCVRNFIATIFYENKTPFTSPASMFSDRKRINLFAIRHLCAMHQMWHGTL